MSLSAKHKAFCDEYLANGMNATQAYKSVYKTNDKVSEASASRLLLNVKVKEYLQEERQKIAKQLNITKEELLLDLKEIVDRNKGIRDATAMKAIEIINKMSGFDAPIKQDIQITEQPLFLDDQPEN